MITIFIENIAYQNFGYALIFQLMWYNVKKSKGRPTAGPRYSVTLPAVTFGTGMCLLTLPSDDKIKGRSNFGKLWPVYLLTHFVKMCYT